MKNKEKIILAVLLVIFLDIFLLREADLMRKERLIFCDVGQGDGAVIALGKTQAVIDAGPDNSILGCLGKYLPYFDRAIEYLIISHPDKDHVAGAAEILKRYEVGAVITNGGPGDSPEYEEFLRLAEGKIIPAEDFEDTGGMFHFLDYNGGEGNDNRLVFKFFRNGKNFLFTGDISAKAEKKLLESGADLKSDILKVAHHGSGESSSPEFLKAVLPELAVISAGAKNKYGHPAYIILKRLENFGIRYLRTDEAGSVIVGL